MVLLVIHLVEGSTTLPMSSVGSILVLAVNDKSFDFGSVFSLKQVYFVGYKSW